MNKGNKILLGALTFVVVCVVGYALFSESITITGSVTTSGDWQIKTTCTEGASTEAMNAWQQYLDVKSIIKEGGYKNSSCNVIGNKVTMNAELQYPTALRAFTIRYKNAGSIDAFIRQDGNTPVNNKSIIVYNPDNSVYKEISSGASEFNYYLNQFGKFRNDVLAVIKTASGTFLTEADWQDRIYEKTDKTLEYEYYLKLEPGDTLEIVSWVIWNKDATLNDGKSAKTTAETIGIIEQNSSNMQLAPDGYTCFSGC